MTTEESVIEAELPATDLAAVNPKTVDVPNDLTPSAKDTVPVRPEVTETNFSAPDRVVFIALLFRDGLDMPIPGLELFVTLPSGQMCMATSTAQGAMSLPIPPEASGLAKVEVKDITGKRQEVCSIDLAQCKNAVVISSPKVKVDLSLRPHQQTPPALSSTVKKSGSNPSHSASTNTTPAHVNLHSPWWRANGAWETAKTWLSDTLHLQDQAPASVPKTAVVQKTLSKAGQPVTVVTAPECPNKDNLKLGRNNVYRDAILEASKRLGLKPQALCALIDCEAGHVTEHIPLLDVSGKQIKDKKGKLLTTKKRELWNANAGNEESGAAGLTQFLGSTWLRHALLPGCYIHKKCVANGWVRQETIINGTVAIKQWGFVLADGKISNKINRKMWGDANVKKCLATRMDPTWSINAAADYGDANLKVLKAKGFKLDDLNDMDKAKLMYVMHHEGEGSGPLFISNTLANAKGGVERLRKVFAIQLGKNGAALSQELIDRADDDVELAYRTWLAKYIDIRFDEADKFFCADPISPKSLSVLMLRIGGEKL